MSEGQQHPYSLYRPDQSSNWMKERLNNDKVIQRVIDRMLGCKYDRNGRPTGEYDPALANINEEGAHVLRGLLESVSNANMHLSNYPNLRFTTNTLLENADDIVEVLGANQHKFGIKNLTALKMQIVNIMDSSMFRSVEGFEALNTSQNYMMQEQVYSQSKSPGLFGGLFRGRKRVPMDRGGYE